MEALADVEHQRQHLRLDCHVERGRRLVGDQQLGVAGHRHRRHHPLPHPAGELVGIGAEAALGVGHADEAQEVDHPGTALGRGQVLVQQERLVDLVADRHHRVQGRHRLLEDHADVLAADAGHLAPGQLHQVAALEQDPPRDAGRRLGDEPEDRERGQRLARAALADDADAIHRRGPRTTLDRRRARASCRRIRPRDPGCRGAERSLADFRVEHVADGVADDRDRQHHDGDGETACDDRPLRREHVGQAVPDDVAPGRVGRLRADAEEAAASPRPGSSSPTRASSARRSAP